MSLQGFLPFIPFMHLTEESKKFHVAGIDIGYMNGSSIHIVEIVNPFVGEKAINAG